jgi:hypothetical protein
MLPVRKFEEDDDSLPSIKGPSLPYSDEEDVDNGRRLSRLSNPMNQSRAEHGDIYSGGHGNRNMTLRELELYVQETVSAQRQQRRKRAAMKSALICSFVFLVMTVFSGGSLFVYEDRADEVLLNVLPSFQNPYGYVLSQ